MLLFVMLIVPRAALVHTTSPDWQNDPRTRLIRVREAGIVRLTWDALAETGWELAVIPAPQVQIWRAGQQIPLQVTAAGVAFRAEANTSRFTSEATYWLGVGNADGLRTLLPTHATAALVWEIDQVYQSIAPTIRGDHWFAGELRTGDSRMEIPLMLPNVLPTGTAIDVALTAIEPSAAHLLTIYLGNQPIAHTIWAESNALKPRRITLITEHALPVGNVPLTMRLTTSQPDLVLIDSISIAAAQLPLPTLTPILEHPRSHPPITQADQLIIAHPDFIAALAPLVAFKQQQGMEIALVDVLAIYDNYGWGERDPAAIRAYLAHVFTAEQQNSRTAEPPYQTTLMDSKRWLLAEPEYSVIPQFRSSVLLVGAGTARMRFGPDEVDSTRIPPYLLDLDPVYGEIACDSCYTRLHGSDEILPDLPIGRLPARDLAEAEVMVAKTLTALHPIPGDWQQRALLVADNDRDAAGVADPAGPFTPLVAEITTSLTGMQVESLVYAPDQLNSLYHTAPALRNRLLPAWDAGVGLIAYIGHASPWQWAFTGPLESVPHLLNRGDAVRTNTARLPILLSMTCLSGSFQNPTLTTVDEELVRQPSGGIAAALSPTGSGVNTGHTALLQGVLRALVNGQTLGSAHLAGLQALMALHSDTTLAYSYGILGDPDIRLPANIQAGWRVALPLLVK